MLFCLSAIMMNTMLFCCAGGNELDRIAAYQALWDHIRQKDPKMYNYLSYRSLPALVKWMPWRMRGKVMYLGYQLLCKTILLG